MLDKERQLFSKNLPEWLKTHPSLFVLIKDEEVIGFFNTHTEALSTGISLFDLDSFLIRQITENQDEVSIPAYSLGVLNATFPPTVFRDTK